MRIKSITVNEGDLLVFLFDKPLTRARYQKVSLAIEALNSQLHCKAVICEPGQDVFLGHPVQEALEQIEHLVTSVNDGHNCLCGEAHGALEDIASITHNILKQIHLVLEEAK